MKRNLLLALFVFSVLSVGLYAGGTKDQPSSVAPGSTEAPVKIRLAIQPGDIQPTLGQELGYFKEEGLDVELITFSYGPPIIEAFTSKNVDFGLLGDLPAYSGIANGVDITIVGTYSTSETHIALAVRDAANIKKLEDLKGKKVSVPFGSNSQPLLYLYLQKAGLKDTEVEIINLSFTDSVAAIATGRIDATVISEPNLSRALHSGGVSQLATAEGLKLFVNPIIARGEFITVNPLQTAKLLKILDKAGKWAKENRDEAAQIISDFSGVDLESIKLNIDKRDLNLALPKDRINALVIGADQSLSYGLLTQKIDVAGHIDVSYLEAAGIQ
ncbi:aliphatic sulfonate ABC transporter substrate-binding protein [Treponema primitia]|uniref:ABC transporter substrate-binding protein n=1 Tax=Treponema primitia TaxID=88058 RepID=UPI00397FCD0B